jgi:hypothetical protein
MEERSATEMALRAASQRSGGEPTLPRVVDALFGPAEVDAAELRTTAAQLAEDGRTAALGLRQMVSPRGSCAVLSTVPPGAGSTWEPRSSPTSPRCGDRRRSACS